ncbi:MAG TPA: hypothetical protein IAB70_06405 [Candidatus Merdicola faecigallinarum]|uniref:Uncharacterized protein n=1 Tax=Candidatus Merdicola faecigallinarum TaxID=2840862 RepID=A0A9D1SAA7_9FIRM|nr:hypothetical protein [Candidatus Merdicola faecigallinarum]
MVDMSFAEYILSEKSLSEKMKIILYFKRKHECFFDNTVIFKTEMAREFLEHTKLDIDSNLVLTACLLYGCKKTAIAYDINKVKTYAKEGAEYLKTLGFDDHFCQICMQVNRYEPVQNREKEGDFLELIDNFGMLLDRDDRRAFTPVEALFILENENLAGLQNRYLDDFKEFVMEVENLNTLGIDKSKIITKWQKKINALPKYDIVHGINAQIEYRTEARKIYIEGKKIEKNKDGYRDNRQKLNAERRLKQEVALEIDKNHKFSELLEDENIS